MILKKLFLTCIAGLFLATGAAHSEEECMGEYIWYYDCRHGQVTKDFTRTANDEYDNPPVEVSETHATVDRKEI
jgi:hypothetical protein